LANVHEEVDTAPLLCLDRRSNSSVGM
jgi:hypothetical protein